MATFISYKFNDDRNKYEDVCYAFDREGIRYWTSAEIAAGQSLRVRLQDAIRQCPVCVFIATANSLGSAWCQAEIGAFWGLARPVVVYLADAKLTEDDLPKQFTGDKFAGTIREVVDAVRVHLTEPTEVAQTESVWSLAIDAFLDKLNLQFRTNRFLGFGSLPGLGGNPGSSVRYVNAFGQLVGYDPTRPDVEAESELRAVIKGMPALREKRERVIAKTLLKLFVEVQGQAQSIERRLGRFPLGSKTLADSWARAQGSLAQLWEEKSRELACFDPGDLDRVRRFLEEHPAYRRVSAQEEATIDGVLRQGVLSVDELIEMTGRHLARSMKDLGPTH